MRRAITAMAGTAPQQTVAQRAEEAYQLRMAATKKFTDRANAGATIRARFTANVVRRDTPRRLQQEAAREVRSENNHADKRAQEYLEHLQRQYINEYCEQQWEAARAQHSQQQGTAGDPITLDDSDEPTLMPDTDTSGESSEHSTQSDASEGLMPSAVMRARSIYTAFKARHQAGHKLQHLQLLQRTLVKLARRLDLSVCTAQVAEAFPRESHASMAARGSVLSGIHGDYDSAMQARLMAPKQTMHTWGQHASTYATVMALLQLDRKAMADIWPTVEAGEQAFYKLHSRQLEGWRQWAKKATTQRASDDATVLPHQSCTATLSEAESTLSESDGDSTVSQ